MGGFAAAWLVGLGVVSWREVHSAGHMPVPAALAGVTGLFAALAIVADASPASRPVVTMLAWGLDIAGIFNILPAGLFGQIQKAQQAEAGASGAPAGSITAPPAQQAPVSGGGPGHRVQGGGSIFGP